MSVLNRAALQAKINSLINDNESEEITPARMREILGDIVDSCFNRQTDDSDEITQGDTNLFFGGRVPAGTYIVFKGTGNTAPSDEENDFRLGVRSGRIGIQYHTGSAWEVDNPIFQLP